MSEGTGIEVRYDLSLYMMVDPQTLAEAREAIAAMDLDARRILRLKTGSALRHAAPQLLAGIAGLELIGISHNNMAIWQALTEVSLGDPFCERLPKP
jgi:hypothetical protein